ncbi:hypothetical protein [Deinococcus radiomollis]|uniref:hypothetical protein n=1 Tax=Deinococcus radiomollis TaxID=468916 RepID=UPI0038914DD4
MSVSSALPILVVAAAKTASFAAEAFGAGFGAAAFVLGLEAAGAAGFLLDFVMNSCCHIFELSPVVRDRV